MQGESVISRKISGVKVSRPPIPHVEEIGEDFAKLLDERLRRVLNTMTSSIILGCEVRKLSRVLEGIPVPAMLGVVEVPGATTAALVNISNDLIYHIIDLRMGGNSETSPVPTARSITALDCALCKDFVDGLLDGFAEALRVNLEVPHIERMRMRKFEQHVNMARIAPENADVLAINVALDIGEAARSGELDLIVPLSVLDTVKAEAQRERPENTGVDTQSDIWARRMLQAARDAPLRLHAILHREHFDIGTVQDWKAGDMLMLPDTVRSRVELVLPSKIDTPLAVGRLGAREARKAIKLSDPPSADLQGALRQVLKERRRK
ncbi:MAG: FliM/FliN family flagellar motor switch protein [Pseudomonadota bacterium]